MFENIYKFIRDIILKHEPNAEDEFEVLDKIFLPNPWELNLSGGFHRRFSF